MTGWVSLPDALLAVALEGESMEGAFKRLVLRHIGGAVTCRAGMQSEAGKAVKRDVELRGDVWNDAPFWYDTEQAILANAFAVRGGRSRVVLDLAFDRQGVEAIAKRPIAGIVEGAPAEAPPVEASPPLNPPAFSDAGTRKRAENSNQRALRLWLERPAIAATHSQHTQDDLWAKFKAASGKSVSLSWFKKWYQRHRDGEWWETLRIAPQ